MALATLTLTTNGKCIDFHKNDGEITGVEGGDEYLYIDKIMKLSILEDAIIIVFLEDSEIFLPFDQVQQIGGTTELPHFSDVASMKSALKTMLEL